MGWRKSVQGFVNGPDRQGSFQVVMGRQGVRVGRFQTQGFDDPPLADGGSSEGPGFVNGGPEDPGPQTASPAEAVHVLAESKTDVLNHVGN